MDLNELREMIKILEDSGLSEIEVEEEGRRIRLSKPAPGIIQMAPQMQHYAAAPAAAKPEPETVQEPSFADQGLFTIDSPMVGTFYQSPAPGEPPFILPGDQVAKEQTVCIVEAMKIMNEVASKTAGVIVRILVENGDPVEYGQPLFALRPISA